MILEILIVIILLWIFTYSNTSIDDVKCNGKNCEDMRSDIKNIEKSDNEKINEIRKFLNTIVIGSKYKLPKYEMGISNDRTYVKNKYYIKIVLRDKYGNYYSMDTLYYVALHEMAHILTEDEHHTEKFLKIENSLITTANNLKYLNKEINLDENYPVF